MNCGKLALAALGCVLCISTAQTAIVRGTGGHSNDGQDDDLYLFISPDRDTHPEDISASDQQFVGPTLWASVVPQFPDPNGLACVAANGAIGCDYSVGPDDKRLLRVTAEIFGNMLPNEPLVEPTLDVTWSVFQGTTLLRKYVFEDEHLPALNAPFNFDLNLNGLPTGEQLSIGVLFRFTLPEGADFYRTRGRFSPESDIRDYGLNEFVQDFDQEFTAQSFTFLTIDPNSELADDTAPVSSALAVPGPNLNGWNKTQVNVTITAADETDGSGLEFISYEFGAGNANSSAGPSVSQNVNTEGSTSISYFAADQDGNQEAPKNLVVNLDFTNPTIGVVASPAANVDGWNKTPVTVNFTCTDSPSGIDTCTGDQTLSSQGAGQVANGTATDKAGNSASASKSVSIDLTPPTITGAATPAPNGAGWNRSNVTVAFTCTDGLSEIKTCDPASTTISDDGAGKSATSTATDKAGNSANASVTGINLDKIDPNVTVTGVADDATYPPGGAPAAGCSTTDGPSGVATAATLALTGGTSNGVGSFTAACTGALDKAGNGASASATYKVQYNYSGFFSPVDNLPVVNSVKAGQAVPVKFRLAGDFGLDVLQVMPQSQSVGCSSAMPLDAIEQTVAAGSSSLSYDPATSQYSYVWKTDKSFKGCRSLIITLDDGTVHTAFFKFN